MGSNSLLSYNPYTALSYGAGSGGRFLAVWPYSKSTSSLNAQLLDETGTKVGGVINVSNPFLFANNTVVNSAGDLLQISGSQAGGLIVRNNNLLGNGNSGSYHVKLIMDSTGRQTITAINNYWGPIQVGEIGGRIYDCNDDANTSCGANNATQGEVVYEPALNNPDPNAPAFVYKSTFDPSPVGLDQAGTVTLEFSRPMDTTRQPALTFYDSRRGTTQELTEATNATFVASFLGRKHLVWVRKYVAHLLSRRKAF